MADVQPLQAIRYDTAVAGPLSDLTAPSYDVISPAGRAALLNRSSCNVVAIELRALDGEGRQKADPSPTPTDPYQTAGALFASWQSTGVLSRDPTPALWAHTQEYTGPD